MRRGFPRMAWIVVCMPLLMAGLGFWGCGDEREIAAESTSTTAGSTSITGLPNTGATTPPSTGETTSPETTVFTGTTVPGSQTLTLTFLGPVSQDTWRALREIVMSAEDDGQRVLDDVAALAAGPQSMSAWPSWMR